MPRGGSRRQRPQFFLHHRLQQRTFISLRATECNDGRAKCSISGKIVESVRDVVLLPAPPSSTATTFKGSVDDSADSRNSSTASGCIIAARLGGSSVGRTRYSSPISVTLDQGSKLPVVASAAAGRKAYSARVPAMVGASIDNDWRAALWRGEEEEAALRPAADADEILLMLLLGSFFPLLLRPRKQTGATSRGRSWACPAWPATWRTPSRPRAGSTAGCALRRVRRSFC